MLPLEDSYLDIIGKAQRGLKLSPADLARRTGLSTGAVEDMLSGKSTVPEVLSKMAGFLGLGEKALQAAAQGAWKPESISVDGLQTFTTNFEDMTVNAYLVWDAASKEAVVFDTGADVQEMLDFAKSHNLKIGLILITHTHGDHIYDLDRLKEKTGAQAYVGDKEPTLEGAEPFPAGRSFQVGKISVDTRLTWGHAVGGITYVVGGLARPIAVVGDAIFAGSMGGGMVSYEDALRTNREEILTLPEDTVLCPGHGPLTTVGEQKVHNPFFAA